MNAMQAIALTKAVSDKEAKAARAELKPGKVLVDLTVRITGAVSVAEDTAAAPTAHALSLEAVATALHFAGVTRERAIEALARIAVNGETVADEERRESVDAIVSALQAKFAALPKVPRKGAVRATLIVREIETPALVTVTERVHQPEFANVGG